LRFEDRDEVRARPGSSGAGDDVVEGSVVVLREVGTLGEETLERRAVEGSSVVEEVALGGFPPVSEDPWRRLGGGGGGTFCEGEDAVSLGMPGLSKGNSVIECCDEMVRFELLRDRLPFEVRSWLCLRASGTGGGIFFCGVGG